MLCHRMDVIRGDTILHEFRDHRTYLSHISALFQFTLNNGKIINDIIRYVSDYQVFTGIIYQLAGFSAGCLKYPVSQTVKA